MAMLGEEGQTVDGLSDVGGIPDLVVAGHVNCCKSDAQLVCSGHLLILCIDISIAFKQHLHYCFAMFGLGTIIFMKPHIVYCCQPL